MSVEAKASHQKKESPNDGRNIVLIGMTAAGKTTIGRGVAEQLSMKFVDVDDFLVERHLGGMKISEFAAKYGWDEFRRRETLGINVLARRKNTVISTGGGAIKSDRNMASLRLNGITMHLFVPLEELIERAEADPNPNRPLGENPRKTLTDRWNEPDRDYRGFADYIVPNTSRSPEIVVDEIVIAWTNCKL